MRVIPSTYYNKRTNTASYQVQIPRTNTASYQVQLVESGKN